MSQYIESLLLLVGKKMDSSRSFAFVYAPKLAGEIGALETPASKLVYATHLFDELKKHDAGLMDAVLKLIAWCDEHGVDCPAFRDLHARPGLVAWPEGSEEFERFRRMLAVDMNAIRKAANRGAAAKPADDSVKGKRKRRRTAGERPLTDRQKQSLELLATHNGHRVQAAKAMGVSHATFNQHVNAAWRKLPFQAPKDTPAAGRTRHLRPDKRGQADVRAGI